MKLLLVIPALGPVYGGPSKIAPMLAAALARQGIAVDIVTTNADGAHDLKVPDNCWVEENGYRIRYFRRSARSEYKLSFAMFDWLCRSAGGYDAAHVISNFNFPVLAGALACRLRRTPYLINPQGMLEPWALGYKGWKKRFYYRWIERPFVLGGAHAIQALNRNEAENIRALNLGPPVFVIPNGIEPDDAQIGESDREAFLAAFPTLQDKTIVLFLHRIDPKKGLDLLARAFGRIRLSFPQVQLVIAGPDAVDHTPAARGFFDDEGCQSAVTFTGMLTGTIKRGALAAASVFVLPSYSEGFSMSVLEAMAAGLPCVITTGCNFSEAGEAQVAKVVAPEAEKFATALAGLLANPDAAKQMGARARAFVLANYTWENVAARLGDRLAEDVGDRHPR